MGWFPGKNLLEAVNTAIETRQENRTERTALRQDSNTTTASYKYAAQSTAYQNGMDPKAAWAGAAASMTNSVAAGAVGIFGKEGSDANFLSNTGNVGAMLSNPIVLGIIALFMLLMFGKKGKRK